MIVLDTTSVSALMQPGLNPAAVTWLDRQQVTQMHMTTITVMEIRAGIERLPASARRRRLGTAFDSVVHSTLRGRILDFDFDAAMVAGALIAERLRAGRPIDAHDTQIAGIAVSRSAAIATRNVRHFEDLPVQVINPWDDTD
jgi:predicted nucleic acid-binding protein